MKLKEYIERFCVIPSNLAKKVGLYHQSIFRIIREGRIPSLTVAIKIEDFTEGKVTPRDIYEECLSIKEINKKQNNAKKKKN